METFRITLADDIAELVYTRAVERGYPSPADYLQALITSALDQEDRDRLEAMLIEGLESGPPLEGTDKFWGEFKEELNKSYHRKGVA
jgi:antitoxin ParD1/3/4